MLLQRGAVLPRKSAKKPRPTPVARGVITNVIYHTIEMRMILFITIE